MRKLPILLSVLLGLAQLTSIAQCKLFTQNMCFDQLGDYTNSGSYNGAIMYEGEEATLSQTFYKGQSYRIVLCTQEEALNKAYFELLDYKGITLYSSAESSSKVFDFNMESTQILRIKVVVPKIGTNDSDKQNGCVSVVVGFKAPKEG